MNKQEWKAKYGLWRSVMRIPGYDETQNVWSARFNILYELLRKDAPDCSYAISNSLDKNIAYNIRDHRRWAIMNNMRLSREACERIRLQGWPQ